MARFELTTFRTPSERATRLRHIPFVQLEYECGFVFVKPRVTSGCAAFPPARSKSV